MIKILVNEHSQSVPANTTVRKAGIRFLENGGERSIIASLFSASSAIQGKSGTTITKSLFERGLN